MQSAGFTNISSEDAVKLRIFKVTPEFLSEMKAEGLSNLSVETGGQNSRFLILMRRLSARRSPTMFRLNVEKTGRKDASAFGETY